MLTSNLTHYLVIVMLEWVLLLNELICLCISINTEEIISDSSVNTLNSGLASLTLKKYVKNANYITQTFFPRQWGPEIGFVVDTALMSDP